MFSIKLGQLVTGFLPRIYRSVRVFCHIFIDVSAIPYIVLIYGNLSKWQNTLHFLKLWRSDGNFSGALAESRNQYALLLEEVEKQETEMKDVDKC